MHVIFKEETNYYNVCEISNLPEDTKLKKYS